MATHALVTGAAGFLGSHLAERLLAEGARVTSVDCFTNYSDPALKRRNVREAQGRDAYTLLELDLSEGDRSRLPDVDVVFHQAAQAGVRASWGAEFAGYTHHNVLATQRGSAHYPSMLEDVEAHRATEIDLITGSLVREAERHGVPVPLHTALYRLVKAREESWTVSTPTLQEG